MLKFNNIQLKLIKYHGTVVNLLFLPVNFIIFPINKINPYPWKFTGFWIIDYFWPVNSFFSSNFKKFLVILYIYERFFFIYSQEIFLKNIVKNNILRVIITTNFTIL